MSCDKLATDWKQILHWWVCAKLSATGLVAGLIDAVAAGGGEGQGAGGS